LSLNYVNLVLDFYDGRGSPVQVGSVICTPNVTVTDSADHVIVTQAPIIVRLFGNPTPTVRLVASDNSGLLPAGWGWLIQPEFPGGPAGELYLVSFANGPTQYLSQLMVSAIVPGPGAEAGYAYIPSVSGAPVAVPPAGGGTVPVVIDLADHQLWAYISGSWKAITLS